MTSEVNSSARLTGWYSETGRPGNRVWWNGSSFERDHSATALSFKEAVRKGLMDWSFNKRASRSEYWFFALATQLVSVSPIALRIVFRLIGNEGAAWLADSGTAQAVLTVVSLSHIVVLFFCGVVLFKIWVKRMHDRGVTTGAILGRVLVYVALVGAVYLATLGVLNFPSHVETLLLLLTLAALLWNVVEVSLPGHRHTNRYNVADPTTL